MEGHDLAPIGFVGYDRMGGFVAGLFARSVPVRVYDPDERAFERALPDGVVRATLAEAAGCEIVFLFPPIDRMEPCCRAIAPHLRCDAIVVEGCSVMSVPVAHMQALLPSSVDLVGCHPLFGPESGVQGVKGFTVLLSPVRTSRLERIATLFASLGVRIAVRTPEEHDRAMARTQALEQMIGRTLIRMGIEDEPIDVPGYKKLVGLRHLLESDAEELVALIVRHNPFAEEVLASFEGAWSDLRRLAKGEATE